MLQKIYVGGCYNNIAEIREAQTLFKGIHGIHISYDWTIRAEKAIARKNENLAIDAQLDIQGVLDADWSVFLMTDKDYVYRGTFAELGASIVRDIKNGALNKTIVVGSSDAYATDCCFWHHPAIIHFETVVQARDYVAEQINEQSLNKKN